MSSALRIVIVEDNFLLAEALSDTLTKLGYSVIACCGSVREAMTIVEAADFDLAIVDLDLHDLDAAPILDQLIDRHIP